MAIQTQVTQNLVPVMTVFNSDGSCAGLVGPGGNFLSVPIGAQTPNTGAFTTLTTTGNIGMSGTPSAWGSTFSAIDIWNANSGIAASATLWAGSNYYQDAATQWRYKSSAAASLYTNNASGYHAWYNAPSGTAGGPISFTEQMRLDSSGNLGIGATPSAWGNNFKAIDLAGNVGIAGFANNLYQMANAYAENAAYKYRANTFATMYLQTAGTHQWYIAPSGTAGNAISWTTAMTLDTTASLLLGATNSLSGSNCVIASGIIASGQPTASGYTNVNSAQLEGTSGRAIVNHINGTATASLYIGFGYNAASIGSITQSGTTAVLYNTTSDQRLKENIVDADSASSLIDAVQVRQFDWKADGSHQRYGFVAQELVQVVPEAVHTPVDEAEMMAVDYSKLVPLLVKEIQELRARVATLEGKKR